MADPKTGTGKKPKGSGRRLYTDENPRDTVKIKFATPADASATVAKVKRINKPFARLVLESISATTALRAFLTIKYPAAAKLINSIMVIIIIKRTFKLIFYRYSF